MIMEWNVFRGWRVLEYFLLHPNTKIHPGQLSRNLKISRFAAQTFCTSYLGDGILSKTEVGNINQFCINEDDARVRALKLFMGPYLVMDSTSLQPFLRDNRNVLSIAIYGSFAAGDYGDRSDLDLIIITADEKKPESRGLSAIELRLGREVSISVLSMARWRAMEKKKDAFFLSVKKNHVIVWGNAI